MSKVEIVVDDFEVIEVVEQGPQGVNGINTPTEIVDEFPVDPVEGTIYFKVGQYD